ncbi:MAG TPA: ABC transporter substrate-binding protein [Acidimicrobiales bacterium]|nr:ABC transporter substrate-binding protein [Acidimicrobiales bacterium]
MLGRIVRGRGGGSPDGRRRRPTGEVRRTGRTSLLIASLAVLLALLPGCSGGKPAGPAAAGGDRVVVAGFNFPESTLLAEIYAGALERAGVPVRRELDLGPRELVQPAQLGGLVDVVPEYLGSALASLEPGAGVDTADPAAVRRRLAEVLAPRGVRVLEPSPAQNQNGLAVTKETAARLKARTVSDLRPTAGGLALAGPPECPQRPYCVPGYLDTYGLRFGRFLPFDSERQRVTALRDDVADVAVMFTTDGELAGEDLVLLEDDRRLQPAENVVPLVSDRAAGRYGARVTDTLNAVSAALTSENLRFLNWRVSVAGKDVRKEAAAWLDRHNM